MPSTKCLAALLWDFISDSAIFLCLFKLCFLSSGMPCNFLLISEYDVPGGEKEML